MVSAPIMYFDGGVDDTMGGPSATFHRGTGTAVTPATTTGAPNENGDGALRFNGDNTFAYLPHSEDLEVQNGTVALWVRPESLDGTQHFVAKDESGSDAGGHFYIGMVDGHLEVRFAPGDGTWGGTWRSTDTQFEIGEWSHVAVSFGANGVRIFVDGERLSAGELETVEGRIDNPAFYKEAHLLGNDKPLVIGAGTKYTEDTSSVEALTESGLKYHFNGDIDGLGVWGGSDPSDALLGGEIAALASGEPISTEPVVEVIERVNELLTGTDGADVLDGGYGDDVLDGQGDIDDLRGGYGDDQLYGGDGNDQLNGGRGSDLLDGGAGDDLIILGADAGEPKLGQPYDPAENPDGDLNPQTLTVFEGHPIIGDDIAIGGEGADTFVLQPQLNAKRDIILKHQNDDRTINWRGVAGENDEHHDHWPDSIGIDVIADYSKAEGDRIIIDGHTANIDVKGGGIEYRDVNGDGVDESIITIVSNQPNGGAHDQDLLGRVTVYGDRVERDDIVVDAGSFAGIVETVEDIDEALYPEGESDPNPDRTETVNPFADQVDFEALSDTTPEFVEYTRSVDLAAGTNDTIEGSDGADVIYGDPVATKPVATEPHAAVSYFTFDEIDSGTVADARGVQTLGYYLNDDRKAVLQSGDGDIPTEAGAPGIGGTAIRFEDDDQFAVIAHDPAYEVLQGTVAVWFKPDDVNDGNQTIVSKDESGRGDGGHMRIEVIEGGQLLLRLAPGDQGGNQEWVTVAPLIESGEWAHIAVSFTEDGVAVYLDGQKLPDSAFRGVDGDEPPLSDYTEFHLVGNEQPWVLGADTGRTQDSSSAATIAGQDQLRAEFKGAVDGFGVWGGMTEADALNGDQIAALVSDGPGDLSAPAYTQDAVLVGDDDISGMGGNDTIYAGAGRDVVDGGSGNDLILGEYGADLLMGRGGADILDGGHGQDVLQGGMGNDVLLSRSDAREPKIAQLFDDEDPNGIPEDESGWAGGGATGPCPVTGGPVCHCGRDPEQVEEDDDPEYEIDPVSGQLYPSQPIPANDILTGGTGADTFRIETLINAKEDIILKHVRDDGTINWAGVAGENNRYHDHWVDSIGDDRITDFNRAEGDKIEIAGHTTEIASVVFDDLDGDGRDESTVIHLISNQGGNGGAHDQDYLGSITVENVILVEDDVSVDSNPTYGIVDTIYELDDAITPLYASDEEARTGFGTAGETPSMPPEATVVDPPAPAPAPAPSPEPTPTPAPEADGDGKPKQLFGDEGANTVNGTDAGEKIAALAGDDIVMGGDGRDLINGGTGNDTLHGEGGRDVLAGGDGDDELIGGADDDFGFGGNGDDTFQGGAGDDRFFGGAGNDTATGGIGDDVLAGRLDNDTLIGNGGDDVLIGGGGDNRLIGGTGDDQHSAGIGRNTIVYDEAGYGDDTVYGFSDDDLIEVSTDLAASFDDVTVVSVAPTRTELQFGNGSVTLVGVAANEINDADFIFA